MFLLIVLGLVASAYVSNAKIDENIKTGVNIVVILVLLLILVFAMPI